MAAKRTGRKRRASGTTTRKIDLKNLLSEAKKPALLIGGLWAGAQIAKALDRSVTPAVSGVFGLDAVDGKRMVTPILIAGAGLVATQMSSDQNVKYFGYGVATAGGIVLAKNLINVDIVPLSGADRIPIPGLGQGDLRLDDLEGMGNDDEPIAGNDNEPIAGYIGNDEDAPIA